MHAVIFFIRVFSCVPNDVHVHLHIIYICAQQIFRSPFIFDAFDHETKAKSFLKWIPHQTKNFYIKIYFSTSTYKAPVLPRFLDTESGTLSTGIINWTELAAAHLPTVQHHHMIYHTIPYDIPYAARNSRRCCCSCRRDTTFITLHFPIVCERISKI